MSCVAAGADVRHPTARSRGLLLRRERKLTHLTDFGRLIEPHLHQLHADADAEKSTAKRFLSLQEAEIRLGVMCTIDPVRFMGFLAHFRSAKSPSSRMSLAEVLRIGGPVHAQPIAVKLGRA
jgi:hypothetical protein